MNTRKFKGIVFDLDGVLANTEPFHIRHWEMTFERYGKKLPPRWFAGLMGYPDETTARKLTEEHRIEENWSTVLAEKREAASAGASREHLAFPGIPEALKRLEAVPKALATSSCREVAEAILTGSGIRRHFRIIVSSDDVERTKPDPESYLTACRKIGLSPEECIAVEDSPAGIEAARRAGLYLVAVCTSYPREKLAEADIIFETPEEAAAWAAGRVTAAAEERGKTTH